MAKKIIIVLLLVIFLLGCGAKKQVESQPVQELPILEKEIPAAEKTIQIPEKPKNIMPAFQEFVPQEIAFWAQGVRVYPGLSEIDFIPVKSTDMKEFGGTFGPYTQDFLDNWGKAIKVKLCSKSTAMAKVSTPHCQTVSTFFDDGYLTFAIGYDYDEYIGWTALRNYEAYFLVLNGDAIVSESPHVYIRTIKN